LFRQSALINNEWVNAKSGQTFSVIDPATENEIGKVPEMNVEDTKEAIHVAKKAFKDWATLTAKVSYYPLRYVYSAVYVLNKQMALDIMEKNFLFSLFRIDMIIF